MLSEEKPKTETETPAPRWVMTFDAGLRFVGRVCTHDPADNHFVLKPAFEHLNQIEFVQGRPPNRKEAVAPVDMVGDVSLSVRPTAFIWVDDLPEWRQKEIGRLLDEGIENAKAYAMTKRSGIVLP